MTFPEDSPDPDEADSVTSIGLTYARVLQLVQKHGITGLIIVLLAYQLGWLATAQSTACGV